MTKAVDPAVVGLKGLDLEGLSAMAADLALPSYRAGQIARWLYHSRVRSIDEMTNLPAALRRDLSARFALPYPEIVESQRSSDGTRKYLLKMADGVTIETVGLPAGDRLTVCFSTQAGCSMGCSFCATGSHGFVRDLAAGEMADQVSVVTEDFGQRVTNVVAMGQGEPFANYDAVLGALRIINSEDGMGVGARHITVSTSGIIGGIRRFAEEPGQFTLAVSLHSAVQRTRDEMMPGLRAMPLDRLREAVEFYTQATGRRCSFEFALVEGVNDTKEELDALIGYCRGMLVHVNVIPVNPAGGHFDRPSESYVRDFTAALARAGIEASVRTERGADIDAACGQLRQRVGL